MLSVSTVYKMPQAMKKRFPQPQSLIITGASSGIGAALAGVYAAPQVRMALQGRDQERLESVAEQCRQKGADVVTAILDVRQREELEKWILHADEQKPTDLVIANAGISGGTGGDGYESAMQARQIFEVNVTGVFNTIEPLLPKMAVRGHGQIALMSSLASFSGWSGAPAYSASKAAVRIYAEALHGSLAAKGIGVSAICPGFVRTPMTDVNDYAMPFMIEAEKASIIIKKALAKNKARIAFPLRTYFAAGLIGMLPPAPAIYLMQKLPDKPALKN